MQAKVRIRMQAFPAKSPARDAICPPCRCRMAAAWLQRQAASGQAWPRRCAPPPLMYAAPSRRPCTPAQPCRTLHACMLMTARLLHDRHAATAAASTTALAAPHPAGCRWQWLCCCHPSSLWPYHYDEEEPEGPVEGHGRGHLGRPGEAPRPLTGCHQQAVQILASFRRPRALARSARVHMQSMLLCRSINMLQNLPEGCASTAACRRQAGRPCSSPACISSRRHRTRRCAV